MEAFNEFFVLIIGVHEIVLLGFVDEFIAKEIVGDSMVFCIMFMLSINAFIVARDFIHQCIEEIKIRL